MAKGKAAKEAPAEVEETKAAKGGNGDKDFTAYADKEPTDLQVRFAAWIIEKCGLTFKTKAEQAGFEKGVALGVYLRIPFQASPENQAVLEAARAAHEAEKAAKSAPKAKAEKSTKAAGKKATAPAQAEAPEAEAAPVEEAKPAAKAAAAKKTTAAAKPAPRKTTTKKAPF